MQKRGYYFTLDALIALGIFTVGIIILYASYVSVPSLSQTRYSSEDLLQFFSNTPIESTNNPYIGIDGELWHLGLIPDRSISLLEEFAYLYYSNNIPMARLGVSNITSSLIPSQYRFEVWIDNTLIFPNQTDIISKNDSSVILPAKSIVYGFADRSAGTFFGPYVAEVIVWQAR